MSSESPADSLFSWLDVSGNLNTLDVDVVMTSSDKRTAKLTDHVVETGSVITDHVIIMPEELSLELVVTQTPTEGVGFSRGGLTLTADGRALSPTTYPLAVRPSQFQPGGFLLLSSGLRSILSSILPGGPASAAIAQGSRSEAITTTIGPTGILQADTPIDRVGDTHDTLIEIMNGALLVTVSFKGRLYADYLLTSVELKNEAGKFGCASFSVDARAFRTVTGVRVQLPDPADFRALPASKKGNKPTKAGDPDPTKKGKSLLAQGTDAINGAVFTNKIARLFGF